MDKDIQSTKQVESPKILGVTMLWKQEAKMEINAAAKRSAEPRWWIDAKMHDEWLKYQRVYVQWDGDPAIPVIFAATGQTDLGPCGVILGISCLINRVDGRQTDLLYPFPIEDPPIPKNPRRKPYRIVSLHC